MTIYLKNKNSLLIDDFILRCSIGKNGLSKNKVEGDLKTPIGFYNLSNLYYRRDRNNKPKTKLKCIPINKSMGWCNDVKSRNYNKLIKVSNKVKHEKLFRKDYKYDFFIPISYNSKKIKKGKGSAIFIHLTKDYKPTAGCIAVRRKDFLILLSLLGKKTKIKIQ